MTLYYLLRWLALILLGLLIYGQTFQFGFVFDDHLFILTDPTIKDFRHFHVMWQSFPMTRLVGIYSFAFNYYLGQFHPQGYHIFNFIVHLTAVGLVWALAGLLFKITKTPGDGLTKEFPFIIAVIFLVHPCQTQAVTYITQRFESMATVFYLATVYFYLCARLSTAMTRRIILFGLAGLSTILGIMTKEVIITVPAMILACEWILFPAKDNKKLYMAIAAGGVLLYVLFTQLVHTDLSIFLRSVPSLSHDGEVLTPAHYFLTQMRVFLTFLRLLVLPIHQNLDYDYPASTGLLHPPLTLVGLLVIFGIVFLIIKLRRRFPLIAFGLAWVVITFSINLAPRANVIFAHKLYLISFGFFLAAVAALSVLVRSHKMLGLILLGMITALAITSFQRNGIWKNDFILWNDSVQGSPHKARPYNNRGLACFHQGNFPQAFSDYNRAIQINPDYAEAYNNRGLLYYTRGQLVEAVADYNKAAAINPDYATIYSNRALAYYKEGNITQAILDYNKAIEINPDNADDYSNRGFLYYTQGRFTQAISDYNKAREINPDFAAAGNMYSIYSNRGLMYYQRGNFSQAISDLNKAIEINPDYADAYINRGNVYLHQKQFNQAIADYSKAIAIDPKNVLAYNNRAKAYYLLKQYDESLKTP